MIRICISDDFTVDYDEERAMYRVSILEIDAKTMNECWNEICFDAYKDEAVRRGKWITKDSGFYQEVFICSVCGGVEHRPAYKHEGMKYCPNCGARMVGE